MFSIQGWSICIQIFNKINAVFFVYLTDSTLIYTAPCQKPVIERFERKDLPTGGDSATTQRMD